MISIHPLLRVCFGFLLLVIGNPIAAQTNPSRARLDEHSIVRDTEGNIYSAKAWQDSVSLGKYVIRPVDPADEKTEFLILTLVEDQQRRLANMPKPPESKYFTTGRNISNFTARDIEGEKYQLKSLKGKIVVLNFWFIACSPCQREIPELNKLVQDYKDSSNIVFISVCLDDKDRITQFLERVSFEYAIIDNGRFITDSYGIRSYPTHVVVDQEGKITFHTSGYMPSTIPWLRKSIASLLK